MPRCRFWISRLAATMLLVASAPSGMAQDIGDAGAGRRLSEVWCSNCHVVTSTQSRATSTGAPPFKAVARQTAMTAMALRAFLQTPHHRMPDLHLSGDEIDDVTAYINTLRRSPPR